MEFDKELFIDNKSELHNNYKKKIQINDRTWFSVNHYVFNQIVRLASVQDTLTENILTLKRNEVIEVRLYSVLRKLFESDIDLKNKLLETGVKKLIYVSEEDLNLGCTLLSSGKIKKGKNLLGKELERIRARLREFVLNRMVIDNLEERRRDRLPYEVTVFMIEYLLRTQQAQLLREVLAKNSVNANIQYFDYLLRNVKNEENGKLYFTFDNQASYEEAKHNINTKNELYELSKQIVNRLRQHKISIQYNEKIVDLFIENNFLRLSDFYDDIKESFHQDYDKIKEAIIKKEGKQQEIKLNQEEQIELLFDAYIESKLNVNGLSVSHRQTLKKELGDSFLQKVKQRISFDNLNKYGKDVYITMTNKRIAEIREDERYKGKKKQWELFERSHTVIYKVKKGERAEITDIVLGLQDYTFLRVKYHSTQEIEVLQMEDNVSFPNNIDVNGKQYSLLTNIIESEGKSEPVILNWGQPSHDSDSPPYEPNSPSYDPHSPSHEPDSPPYEPNSPSYDPHSPPHEPFIKKPEYVQINEDDVDTSNYIVNNVLYTPSLEKRVNHQLQLILLTYGQSPQNKMYLLRESKSWNDVKRERESKKHFEATINNEIYRLYKEIVRRKIYADMEMSKRLRLTYNRLLNYVDDMNLIMGFKGENKMGELLMNIRKELNDEYNNSLRDDLVIHTMDKDYKKETLKWVRPRIEAMIAIAEYRILLSYMRLGMPKKLMSIVRLNIEREKELDIGEDFPYGNFLSIRKYFNDEDREISWGTIDLDDLLFANSLFANQFILDHINVNIHSEAFRNYVKAVINNECNLSSFDKQETDYVLLSEVLHDGIYKVLYTQVKRNQLNTISEAKEEMKTLRDLFIDKTVYIIQEMLKHAKMNRLSDLEVSMAIRILIGYDIWDNSVLSEPLNNEEDGDEEENESDDFKKLSLIFEGANKRVLNYFIESIDFALFSHQDTLRERLKLF